MDFEKFSTKNVVFSVSSGKRQCSLLLAPRKIWKNPLVLPLEKIFPTPKDHTLEQGY